MNKISIRLGLYIVIAGLILLGVNLLEKIPYDNCMGMISAFERGESNVLPVCPPQPSGIGLYVGLPIQIVGIIILIAGVKDLPIIPSISRQT
jgi:hypothetical protein